MRHHAQATPAAHPFDVSADDPVVNPVPPVHEVSLPQAERQPVTIRGRHVLTGNHQRSGGSRPSPPVSIGVGDDVVVGQREEIETGRPRLADSSSGVSSPSESIEWTWQSPRNHLPRPR
jgi:hypothetical protein